MKIFVTSDTHFGHKNIIKYCNRPFDSVEEMDLAIKTIWNSFVSPKDIIFHLGDVTLKNPKVYLDFLNSLNGTKILIMGNHDNNNNKKLKCWKGVFDSIRIKYKGFNIHMRHKPWDEINSEDLFLHGHCHGSGGIWNNGQIDVGVDCWNYSPVEIEELIELRNEHLKLV